MIMRWIALAAAGLLPGLTAAQDAQALHVASLAATCANCHGTQGRAVDGSVVPGLAGMPRDYMSTQLKAFNDGRNAILVSLEVHYPIMLTMPTPNMAGGDTPHVVAAAALTLLLEERAVRGTFVQVMIDYLHYESPARRCWLFLYDCHLTCSRPIP